MLLRSDVAGTAICKLRLLCGLYLVHTLPMSICFIPSNHTDLCGEDLQSLETCYAHCIHPDSSNMSFPNNIKRVLWGEQQYCNLYNNSLMAKNQDLARVQIQEYHKCMSTDQ